MAGIFSTSPQNVLGYLNGAAKPKGILTGAGALSLQLELGKTYRVQAQGAPSYIGFGASAAEAVTNCAPTAGEFCDSGEVKVFCVMNISCLFIARQDTANTDVRIWEVAGL